MSDRLDPNQAGHFVFLLSLIWIQSNLFAKFIKQVTKGKSKPKIYIVHKYMGLVARKPVCGVSNK